jgi:hypothetical protein
LNVVSRKVMKEDELGGKFSVIRNKELCDQYRSSGIVSSVGAAELRCAMME